jgi:hypothetical protein
MFTRVKKSGRYEYLQIVENRRVGEEPSSVSRHFPQHTPYVHVITPTTSSIP